MSTIQPTTITITRKPEICLTEIDIEKRVGDQILSFRANVDHAVNNLAAEVSIQLDFATRRLTRAVSDLDFTQLVELSNIGEPEPPVSQTLEHAAWELDSNLAHDAWVRLKNHYPLEYLVWKQEQEDKTRR